MVYELFFSYYDQDPENDEEMIIDSQEKNFWNNQGLKEKKIFLKFMILK